VKEKATSMTVRKDFLKQPSWTDAECAKFMHLTTATVINKRSRGELPLAADFSPFRICAKKMLKMAKKMAT